MKQNKPRVLDIIDYPSIADKRFVQIFAGVGSGKSYFAERFIEGDEKHKIPKKTVLIVTSRRSKVDQTLSEDALDIGRNLTGTWGEYHWILGEGEYNDDVQDHVRVLCDDWGTHHVFQKSTICTNAFLEVYQKKIYEPDNITTHLWELFDIIFIDEVHSVKMDAPYQSAPFYVQELVNEILYRQKRAAEDPEHFKAPMCQQIILMTGTPDAIKSMRVPNDAITLDFMERCRNVQPENVHSITKNMVKEQIAEQINAGSRIVYFSNHTKTPSEFCKNTSIPQNIVAVSFSKEEKRQGLSRFDRQTMKRVEASIREKQRIPKDIKLFVTTSRNKEGINIEDKDIDVMYIESHVGSDVIQMAGRVRNGVKHLYIVQDSSGYPDKEWREEAEFSEFILDVNGRYRTDTILNFNTFLEHLCLEHHIEGLYQCRENAETTAYKHQIITRYIKEISERFPYIQYSYFKNEFCFYNLRKSGRKYTKKQNYKFKDIKDGKKSFWDIVHPWFPDANIELEASLAEKSKAVWEEFLAAHPCMECSEDEVTQLMESLSPIWNKQIRRINSTLKKFCNQVLLRKSKDNRSANYKIYVVQERQDTT